MPTATVDGGALGGPASYLRYVEYGVKRLAAENPNVTVVYDLWDGSNGRLAYQAPRIMSAGGVPAPGGLPRATMPGEARSVLLWPQQAGNRLTGRQHLWFEFLIDPDPTTGWNPRGQQNIASFAGTGPGSTGFLVALMPNGSIMFRFSPDGSTLLTRTSPPVPRVAGTRGTGVRIGIDVLLGGAGNGGTAQTFAFYTNSNPLGGSQTWTQFGLTRASGATTIASPPGAVWALGSGGGTGNTSNYKGDIYEFRARSGGMDGPDLVPISPEQWYWGTLANPGVEFGPINGGPLLRVVNAAWNGKGFDEFDNPTFLPLLVPRRPYLAATINTGHNDVAYFGDRLHAKADLVLERLFALTGHLDTAVMTQNLTTRTDGRGYPLSRHYGASARAAQLAQWARSRGVGVIDTKKYFLDYVAACAADPTLITGNRPPGTYDDGSSARNGTALDLIDTRLDQAGVHPYDLGAQIQGDHWVDELTAA